MARRRLNIAGIGVLAWATLSACAGSAIARDPRIALSACGRAPANVGQVEIQPAEYSKADRVSARILAISQHAASDVWTLTLDSGVRVHHRQMPEGLSLSICFWGDAFRGTDSAVLRVLGDALEEPLDREGGVAPDRRVRVNAWATGDSIRVEIDGRPEDAETMFAIASRLLRRDCLDDARAAELIRGRHEREQRDERSAGAALQQAAWRALRESGDDQAIASADVCRAWERILAHGEIDVGIAGDLPRPRVMELASATFTREWDGVMDPASAIAGAGNGDARGDVDVAREPKANAITIERVERGFSGRAVLVGLIAPGEALDIERVRALRLAADVLEDRLAGRIAAGEVGARYEPRAGMSARRMLYGVAIDAGEGDMGIIKEEIERLVREGVRDDEVAKAGVARADRARELLDRAGYWAGVLSERSRLAIDLDDVIGAPLAYRRIDARAIGSASAELAETAAPVRIVIVGEKPRAPPG